MKNNSNWQDGAARYIVRLFRSCQQMFSAVATNVFNKIPVRFQKLSIVVFSLVWTMIVVFIVYDAIEEDFFKTTKIESNSFLPIENFKKIQLNSNDEKYNYQDSEKDLAEIKALVDSILINDRALYDSLLVLNPGLMDSVIMLEKQFQSNK